MVVTRYGRPLEPAELPAPKVRPGHALLEVLTCGVCFSDVKTSRGAMPFSDRLSLPHVPGHEICGRVLATDPPGALEPGTVVVVYHVWPCRRCARCRAGEDMLCREPRAWTGFTHPGGFQERLVAPLDRLTPVPAGIDPVHAAPLTCALGTAYRAVVTRGRVAPGTKAVVLGLGGVGIHALQVARASGAMAVGLDVSDRAIEVATDLGLDARRADDPDVESALIAEWGDGGAKRRGDRRQRSGDGAERDGGDRHGEVAGRRDTDADPGSHGADVVIDTVGREGSVAQAGRLVRAGGRIVGVGYSVTSSFVIPSARFVLEEVELVGSRYVRLDELERAIRLVADGRVRTVVDRVLPLEGANAAFEALEAGEVVGRVVLDVAGVAA